jgi:PIN domain nuclease of toxin-antitoxin system
MQINQFRPLPITVDHALAVSGLPHHHRDPFDRLLVAQAQSEKIPLLSADPILQSYAVQILW